MDHLGHLAASCAIILDAIAAKRFNDDRPGDVSIESHTAKAVDLIASWPEAKHQMHG